jgi:hypothetical protein
VHVHASLEGRARPRVLPCVSVRDMRQVSTYTENLYEYHGIRRVWEVARTCHQSTLILYFHGKGMANGQHSVIKDYVNEMLTTVEHTYCVHGDTMPRPCRRQYLAFMGLLGWLADGGERSVCRSSSAGGVRSYSSSWRGLRWTARVYWRHRWAGSGSTSGKANPWAGPRGSP